MTRFAEKFNIESSRLHNFDYSSAGIYHIIICTVHHNNFFGKIINNQMKLSLMGLIANQELLKTFEIRENIKLHEYVIMPNHVHLLMEIVKSKDNLSRDVLQNVSTNIPNVSTNIPNVSTNNLNSYYSIISPKSNSVSNIIKMFKSSVTRIINPKTVFFGWQPRFYDEIITNQKQYLIVKKYIHNNILNWQTDKLYK